uniref:Class III homeodomain-leucine zipper protein C3HDZ1 n=1 Tax=Phaeoceros carolinianus TaxID=185665 RepID=Q20BM0_9EMBR|nr:class III homeodomain-leucine zipper protein C3HDZ1 [Phaeoceros carolinianus]
MALNRHKDSRSSPMDNTGKYVRYTNEQVEALERVYNECPKPSSIRRQQLIKDCPILANIEAKQIKVWFQNRRCREKQRKEATRLLSVNAKLTALNKLLMEENERLSKHTSQLAIENQYLRQQQQQLVKSDCIGKPSRRSQEQLAMTTTDTSSESAVTGGLQQHPTPQHPPRDASPAGLLSIAEETLTEFLAKATGTAVDWIQMPGMKPGPESIGIVAISHGCAGIAARACGLVGLEPTKVAEILKDRPSWLRDCRRLDILGAFPTGNGGTVELIYTQMYAPTTLAPPRDFCTLRYTTFLEDGNLVICERSLSGAHGGPTMPPVQYFVRAEMLPSGYLIRPCDGGGSIIHIVDHVDLEPWSVPEVLRPLYESSAVLAQKTTIGALRHLRQMAVESAIELPIGNGQQPAVLRALSQRIARGFNEAVNGFSDDGWNTIVTDGMDDVSVAFNSSPHCKQLGAQATSTDRLCSLGGGILCAKASMLLQNVPPALLIRFLREHRSEWADCDIDADAAAALKTSTYGASGRGSLCSGQLPMPLAHAVEQEEFLEVVKLEGHGAHDGTVLPRETFLLQLCSGIDENAVGACAQLVFAPVDAAVSDDVPLLPSGFRVIPLDSGLIDGYGGLSRTLDLASTLEGGSESSRFVGDSGTSSCHLRSVLTIAFQFSYEIHTRDAVAAMARQYVRTVVASVQRVAMALAPARVGSQLALRQSPGTPEALLLARRILQSYRVNLGMDLVRTETGSTDALFKAFWLHGDAIVCCSWKTLPEYSFANRSGLEMLEITSGGLQDVSWEKTLDENSRKNVYADFNQVMQQGYAYLPGGVRLSSMGRPATYERAVAWKVILDDDESTPCVAFMFVNWSFLT